MHHYEQPHNVTYVIMYLSQQSFYQKINTFPFDRLLQEKSQILTEGFCL